eukprot:1663905-Alexandrium_andersonii.AAC.1
MPASSSRSTSWAKTVGWHSGGASGGRAVTTATSSASRCATACGRALWAGASSRAGTVSYTHLTLPTICSV